MSKKNAAAKQEVHVHHHYAPRVKKTGPIKRKRKKKNSNKKVISVVVNILDELVRLM